MLPLTGKKVFITGGAVRVGAALVRAFVSAGAKAVIHCHNSIQEGEKLLEEIGGREKGNDLILFDLAERGIWEDEKKCAQIKEIFSGTDILINNASCYVRTPLLQEDMREMERQYQINFFAPTALMKLFAASAGENSCIINILDQGICKSDPLAFSYSLSKRSLADATRNAALAFAPRIRVNAVAPGPVIPPVDMPLSRMEKSIERIPLKRAVKVEDVASACLFLASNSSMTGTILFVDGGLSLL